MRPWRRSTAAETNRSDRALSSRYVKPPLVRVGLLHLRLFEQLPEHAILTLNTSVSKQHMDQSRSGAGRSRDPPRRS